MSDFYLKSSAGAIQRANSSARTLGAKMVLLRTDISTNYAVARKWVWECTTAGTTGAAVPAWPATVTQDITTVTDGTVVWTARKPGFSSGSTPNWAFAGIYLDYVIPAMAAGDTLWVSSAHSESITVATLAPDYGTRHVIIPGTKDAPIKVLCCVDTAAPPTTLATGATVTSTGNSNVNFWFGNGAVYVYGIKFSAGTSTEVSSLRIGSSTGYSRHVYENCTFWLGGSGLNSQISMYGYDHVLINPTFRFGATSHLISARRRCRIYGGSFDASSITPTNGVFDYVDGSPDLIVEGLDFSVLGPEMNISNNNTSLQARFLNCKMPALWSGALSAGTPDVNGRIETYNCSAGDTNYETQISDSWGTLKTETVIVRTGGASDGTTPISFKMVTNADADNLWTPLESQRIALWNEIVGTPITLTVEILHDSATNLTNAEVFLRALYSGSSGSSLGSIINDAPANVLATPADQDTSTAAWTTTGLSNPNKQKISVTVTPQEKGLIFLWVCLAKASKTIYFCPKVVVS